MSDKLIKFIRDTYATKEFIPLHAPFFDSSEKACVLETIETTFVSSVGKFVDEFEKKIQDFTGTKRAVATVNGTAALHTALYLSGVTRGDLVITQALTFVATCNALYHIGAEPVFVDVSRQSLGLCPHALAAWLDEHAFLDNDGVCRENSTNKTIRAVVPMHTFGHPVELDEILSVCQQWNIILVEDAAESLGSYYKNRHTGTIGRFAALSFNGNKIITTGGGGMVLCANESDGNKTKHITTTAKVSHPYEFYHDEPGFNFRMPNLNAALGCAQMEKLPRFLQEKRALAEHYEDFFAETEYTFVKEPDYASSNYWLNAIICPDTHSRDRLLSETNQKGVMTRPIWQLMHRLPMFSNARRDNLENSEWVEKHLINLPSSPVKII